MADGLGYRYSDDARQYMSDQLAAVRELVAHFKADGPESVSGHRAAEYRNVDSRHRAALLAGELTVYAMRYAKAHRKTCTPARRRRMIGGCPECQEIAGMLSPLALYIETDAAEILGDDYPAPAAVEPVDQADTTTGGVQ